MREGKGANPARRPGIGLPLWPGRLAGRTAPIPRGLTRSLALLLLFLGVLAGLALISGPTAAEADTDGDGFSDAAEAFIGTDPLAPCNTTTTASDEADAWPPDFNDDTKIDISDVVLLRSGYGSTSGDGSYDPRFDLNADGKIGISDVVMVRTVYGTACEPTTPPPAPLPAGGRIPWQGQDWYLLGANVPWYNWGCDFGCGPNGGASSPTVRAALDSGFSQLEASGVHVARWWVFPGGPWQITRDGSGLPNGIDPSVYADFDAALELAEQYDLYYVFTLFSSPTRLPASWMSDPLQREKLVEALSGLFARYGDNPRILTWQVFNEPEWHIWNRAVELGPAQATVRDIAAAVHANSNAYVSVGSAHLGGLPMWVGLGLDYYTAHWYDGMSSGEACARCTDYEEVKARYGLDAPLVIGEFFAGNSTDALQRFEDWYAKGYAGAWAWSLFPDRTEDKLSVNLDAVGTFANQHADVGP